MKTRSLFILLMLFTFLSVSGQKLSIELTFTAVKNAAHVQLDSIIVMNRSQGGENIIYYPDTTLSIEITPGDTLLYIGYSSGTYLGVNEINHINSQFQLFQSFPNPTKDQCIISMYLPDDGPVFIQVSDIQGSVIISEEKHLDKGIHSFRFSPGSSTIYFVTASWKNLVESAKIINADPIPGRSCRLTYAGSGENDGSLKASYQKNDQVMQQSGILDAPASNEMITFQFATNIPCPGMPTVEYEGQVYNTIQVFSQCWLKENLNVGTMLILGQMQTDNGIREKYCYDNSPDSCSKYGGLYQWDEMMQYTIQQGTQGICPPGWHVPTSEEWKILEGTVDSQCGIGHPIWDDYQHWRGSDVGSNLKTTSGWNENGHGNDRFGFSGKPAGYCTGDGYFYAATLWTTWWTSTEFDYLNSAWIRNIAFNHWNSAMYAINKFDGHSVRCLRDY